MEEMEEVWKRLRLNDEEEQPIEIQQNTIGALRLKGERSLVGKIISDRRIGKEVVRSMMENVWKVSKPLEFYEIRSNCFITTFVTRRDKVRVLEGCPWLFDSYLLVIKEFDGETKPSRIEFDHACLWVQMLDLPLSYMNQKMGEVIGSSIGEVKEVDVQEDGSAWVRCLRVKVKCDLRRSIARGRTILVDGKKSWIPFRYEKLPRMCFGCGRIVHEKEGCKVEEGISGQYGVWLRAMPQARKNYGRGGGKQTKVRSEESEDHLRSNCVNEENEGGNNKHNFGDEEVEVSEESSKVMMLNEEQLIVMKQEVNKELTKSYVNVEDVQTIVEESRLMVEKLNSNEANQVPDNKKATRWKRRTIARPKSGKYSNPYSMLKRNHESIEGASEVVSEGKRIKGDVEMVCNDDRLGVVAAEQHHLAL
ncbi:uncharacterized protein LOC122290065 [Carya illinoinensis]|uniref:uncharacterized protein LOC122290065 n=1 Tax=Carya illinoinensis TaxID=32201 RepID=UPI001C71D345|nr:uncharacterized protein LOC122290065 [Carya illinoinensis]